MANVTIHIADVFELTKIGSFAKDLTTRVKALFDDCIAFANKSVKQGDPPHTSNIVIATAAKPAPGKLDFLVYLLPIEFHSIAGAPTKDNLLADHWGFTKLEQGGAAAKCEIIAKLTQGDVIGSLVIHEMLHYKTAKGNNALHPTGGLGAATVDAASQLNDANRRDIAANLKKEITPWLDGWDICAGAKARRDGGDPLWNL
ncbi:hypothetical protein [uncultured Rhodoblastus sp.]|uniref:hypothetical protein n=1 Tax=uncultured Rhodoblastus sp. TaxID=543037 RepID=UPI0025CE88B9|nr:hypothetical protein [uncultured Rhodoblastus sp.]